MSRGDVADCFRLVDRVFLKSGLRAISLHLLLYSDGQPIDLLATSDTAELAFKVYRWISRVIFPVVLGWLLQPLCDHIADARIDKYVDSLKGIPDCCARESKAAALGLTWVVLE
jgi:hypothetical protein